MMKYLIFTPTSVVSDAQHEANSSPLPWVAGIIIGAVLSAAILHSDSSCVPVEEKGTITVQNVRHTVQHVDVTCILTGQTVVLRDVFH